MVVKGINVLVASLTAAILNEFICWILIYRTQEYQKLKGSLTRTEKKLETIRNTIVNNVKSKKKKEQRHEDQMKARIRELSAIRAKTLILVLTSMYDGMPVATLPFKPAPFFARFTRRGLPGDDLTEASVTFLYVLCSTCLRPIVSKVFNFGLSKKMNAVMNANPFSKYLKEDELKSQ